MKLLIFEKRSEIKRGKGILNEIFTVEEFIIYIGIQDLSFRLHKLNITILVNIATGSLDVVVFSYLYFIFDAF